MRANDLSINAVSLPIVPYRRANRQAASQERYRIRRRFHSSMPAKMHLTMEARQAAEFPRGPEWQFEPKWDGFRCLACRNGDKVELLGRSGKKLSRYFPDIVAALQAIKARRFVLDGELAIPVGKELPFDELQMRLHPAGSRVRKLATAHPALFIAFDLLQKPSGADLTAMPLAERRRALEEFFKALGKAPQLRLSPATSRRAEAGKWLARAGGGELDGVVAKRLDEPYRAGERAMVKVKWLRSADCVVGGFRYAWDGKHVVGSLLLGLFNERGKLDHVSSDHFRHGTRFVRWRPDKRPGQCTFEQLRQEAHPDRLVDAMDGP
jgi:ATP-dependent DNA ligase